MDAGVVARGVPRGDAQDARASPLPPLCIPPPGHVHPPPPPQPERLVMRKEEAVGNKKKIQVCLPSNGVRSDIGGKIGQKIFFLFKTSQLLSC
jgi:hypothetical protein